MKRLHLIICVWGLMLAGWNVAKAADIELSVQTFIAGIEVQPGYRAINGLALSPDESKLYAAYWTDTWWDPVAVYSTADYSLLDTMSYGRCHEAVAISCDSQYVFTASYYEGKVSRFDTLDGNRRTDLSAGSWSEGLGLSPDCTKLVVNAGVDGRSYDMNNDKVYIYDVSAGNFSTVAVVPLNDEPIGRSVAFSNDSRYAYVPTRKRKSPGARLYEVSITEPYGITRYLEFDSNRLASITSDGQSLYISDSTNSKIWIVGADSLTVTGCINTPLVPGAIGMHSDAIHLFVLYWENAKISVYDVRTKSFAGSIENLAPGPGYIIFTEDGLTAYVSHSNQQEGGITVLDIRTEPVCTFSDDFEDGVIDTSLWVVGGQTKGGWSFSHQEVQAVDGYLEANVKGPTSGWSYGAEGWVRTVYNFNDGSEWLINFRWEARRSAYHTDRFFIQIGDEYFRPSGVSDHWIEQDEPGRATLYGVRMSGADRQFYMENGSLVEAGPSDPKPYDDPVFGGPVDWSIRISSTQGTAILHQGPNGTGDIYSSRPLDPDEPWYVRFFLSDSTSAGFPAGDNRLILYDFSAVCEPAVIEADVDIKPQSCPNPVNVRSMGVLPVAVLGSECFDVADIDIASIRLAGVAPIRSNYEDVAAPVMDGDECECTTEGPDGYTDLSLKFKTEDIVNALGEVADGEELVLTLTGVLLDGTPIEGEDCIRVIKKAKKPKKVK